MDPRDDRAAINLTVDKGVKERALKVLESQGITMSGALRAMVRIGIRQERIPFEVTREPEVAGICRRQLNSGPLFGLKMGHPILA